MAMTANLLVLLLAVAATAVHGVDHTVGGSDGWSQSADLATWASGETFTVGDSLLFSYSGTHSVDIVSKSDYDNCNSGKALKTFSDGQTKVPLVKTGAMYFICPTMGHCDNGMKLAINVVAATTTPSTGTTPSTTTPTGPGSDTTPSILSPPSDSSTPASDGSNDGTTTKSDKGGSDGHFGHFSRVVLGFSLAMAGLVLVMG